jgi:pseudouridine-5'-phosphate glycosidase
VTGVAAVAAASVNPGAPPLHVNAEVRDAFASGRPVVALESTIISHGFPYPENLALARELEQTVRARGAVPATIAISGGAIRVGVDDALLERLAREPGVTKVSRRNLAAVLARGELGATTVAATMLCAHLAGIRVFATGGLGGVHRGAAQTMDISADLAELGRTPVCVVCAGAKAILDLALTLEHLETHGVPVLGVGTDTFPAFYTRDSGLPVPTRVEDPHEVARIAQAHWSIGGAGLVVAVPIPKEDALPQDLIDEAIERAIRAADERGVRGAAWTPFVLDDLRKRTDGKTVVANRALVRNNARFAAELAVALAARPA